MSKKRVCKRCKAFAEGSECPVCKNNQFFNNWQGRIYVLDPNRSAIAQKIGITAKAEYAIKAR